MADPLKLTLRTWLEIHRGLGSLDAIKEGQDIVSLDYDGGTRMTVLRNHQLIERERVVFDKLDRDAAAKHGIADGMPVTQEVISKINLHRAEIEAAKDVEIEIAVTKISLQRLLKRPDGKLNKVPQSTLNRLAPILED